MSLSNWGRILLTALVTAGHSADPAMAQEYTEVSLELLEEVMPGAEYLGPKLGDPPVFEAFGVDPSDGGASLLGYVFFTSDLPPEVQGYSAPITVLVGMDLGGTVTGIEVIEYRESLQSSRGDFLNRGSYLRQFGGKHVAESFRVRADIDGISGATITVDAMSRGIRNSARRVAASYLRSAPADAPPSYIGTVGLEELESLLWAEMVNRGYAAQVSVLEGPIRLVLSTVYLSDPGVGELLVGETNFRAAADSLGTRDDVHLMMIGLGGENPFFFRTSALSFVQNTDTITVSTDDVVMLPLLREGKLQGEVRRSGLVYVDDDLDLSQPFEINLDFSPRGESASGTYQVLPPAPTIALEPGRAVTESDIAGSDPVESGLSPDDGAPLPGTSSAAPAGSEVAGAISTAGGPASSAPGADAALSGPESDGQAIDYGALLFDDAEAEQTALARVLARTSWARFAGFLVLLAMATWTFVSKSARLRWITLAGTFLLLGYFDGGFLSVSHIMAGISVGPSVYLEDLPLLLLVVFTVVTTLFWGRVFCGFLCPFGALQDLLEKVVPKKLRRELPRVLHGRALLVKYVILALVLTPALVGSGLSLFQYFEPFGTVFYWSSSALLWTIAGGILVASAIIPRFYCRYVCPLGAALAIGSLAAPFRIRRVTQCDFCKVCEHRCPTGAIEGAEIDFKECVRCNVCEIQLIEKTGVCKHDVEEFRARLVKLPMAGAGATDG